MKAIVEERICKQYMRGKNTTELGEEFGFTGEAVRMCLHRNGVKIRPRSERHRSYTYNPLCFSRYTIDSMYYAGLLMADGNISGSVPLFQIEILESDRELLDGMREWMFYTGRIETRSRQHSSGNISQMVSLRVTASDLIRDLSRLFGIIPNKSKVSVKLPRKLLEHPLRVFFFRGLFDGDGCVTIVTNRETNKLIEYVMGIQ